MVISDLARGCKELIRGNEAIERSVRIVCCGSTLRFFAVDSGVVLIQVKRMQSLLKVCKGCFD
jgi:hypothetical protein